MGLRQDLAAVAAQKDQPAAVLSEPHPPPVAAAVCADAGGTLVKHVAADGSSSDSDDGSKKRKADQVTNADGEETCLLFLVGSSKEGVLIINDHGGSTSTDGDNKQEAESCRVVVHQDMSSGSPPKSTGSADDSAMVMVSLLAPRRRRRKKKLLILDLNGLLADINQDKHNAHLSHGKFRGKLVFKRPHCDDFLRFCISHFQLGIWSSRLRADVDAVVDILMKDLNHRLLFCWDLSKCTGTGFNTLENKVKPLVLKELKKLWDDKEESDLPWQQGEFSPSNTLLVDDSPYKALRNPPHTAIFPCPYSYKNDKDDALGPGGELRLYLEGLATADDVQRFVRENTFGQPPITDTHPDWEFYKQILLVE